MADPARDQAEGLRRLLGKSVPRIFTVVSAHAGVGKTALVVNLAAAIARGGAEVLVLDENAQLGNINDALGLRTRYDLLHALHGEKRLADVTVRASAGFAVLPAARGVREMARASAWRDERVAAVGRVPRVDVLLADTAPGGASALLAPGPATHEVIVVLAGGKAAVTETYGLIKLLHRDHGTRRFRIVVSRVRGDGEARAIFDNVAAVAQRYLGAGLDFLGAISNDPAISRATERHCTVFEASPDAPAAAEFRALADRLTGLPQPAPGADSLAGAIARLITGVRCAPAAAGC